MGQKGVQNVEGDPIKKTISVAFERQKIRQDQIKEAIVGLGYLAAD
jgi:copper chaperone CopZ